MSISAHAAREQFALGVCRAMAAAAALSLLEIDIAGVVFAA
jgi:hypothetical protein